MSRGKLLGAMVGVDVKVEDVLHLVLEVIRERIRAFMRIVACKRHLFFRSCRTAADYHMPKSFLDDVDAMTRKFLLPVPVMKMDFLYHWEVSLASV